MSAEKIRLATFQGCNCTGCPTVPAGKGHLSIATKEVELHEENGVTTSYTWGEFDRAKYCVGHRNGHPAMEVFLELGAEWRLPSVVERLAQLTEQWGASWVDQVCIPQKTESIRKILAQIPTIFKTLSVIVLLPVSIKQSMGCTLERRSGWRNRSTLLDFCIRHPVRKRFAWPVPITRFVCSTFCHEVSRLKRRLLMAT